MAVARHSTQRRVRYSNDRALMSMTCLMSRSSSFDIAADVLGLDDDMRRILSHCQRELTVNFPVEMDDGSVQVFTGHRVQHNTGARSDEGRNPLSPERHARRSQGPGDVDDLEVRGGRPAVRRRQGRRAGQSRSCSLRTSCRT